MGFLQGIDIDLSGYIELDGTTPFTYVLSDPSYHGGKGERAFVNNIGVGWDYTPEVVPDSFYDADILLYGATAIVPGLHTGLGSMLERGRAAGKINVVTTVYDFLNESKDPAGRWPMGSSDESYRCIDLLITDMEEALRLSGAAAQDEAAEFFAAHGAGATIITNGAEDIHVRVNQGRFAASGIHHMPVCTAVDDDIERNPASAGDTTGCGDNFAGGVLSSVAVQLSDGKDGAIDILDAVAWGAASGGFARFSVGGLYRENEPGEKERRVRHYRDRYRAQTGHA
jgi:sugar/nucleoside kinase (ribokinase family)